MTKSVNSGVSYLNPGEFDFQEVVGVYFPDIIKGDEIGVLYEKDGIANTMIVPVSGASGFSRNYEKIPLDIRGGIKNYALRTIDDLKEETKNRKKKTLFQNYAV